jgi:hypothetical protein
MRATRHLEPSFLILGVQKCGTTSLFQWIAKHPDVRLPLAREVGYFNHDSHYAKGREWYARQFPKGKARSRESECKTFEKTPEYFYDARCAFRIRAYNPDMPLIVLVRDPVERAFSAWQMYRRFASGNSSIFLDRMVAAERRIAELMAKWLAVGDAPSLSECIDIELSIMEAGADTLEPSLIRRGLYAEQLARYRALFPSDQIMVVDCAELWAEPLTALARISEFVGLSSIDWGKQELQAHNRSKTNGQISRVDCDRLKQVFREPNRRFYEMMGAEFGWR